MTLANHLAEGECSPRKEHYATHANPNSETNLIRSRVLAAARLERKRETEKKRVRKGGGEKEGTNMKIRIIRERNGKTRKRQKTRMDERIKGKVLAGLFPQLNSPLQLIT